MDERKKNYECVTNLNDNNDNWWYRRNNIYRHYMYLSAYLINTPRPFDMNPIEYMNWLVLKNDEMNSTAILKATYIILSVSVDRT